MKYTLNINWYLSTSHNEKAELMYINAHVRLWKYAPSFSRNEVASVSVFQFSSTIHDNIGISDL